jgi:hypothetical protein
MIEDLFTFKYQRLRGIVMNFDLCYHGLENRLGCVTYSIHEFIIAYLKKGQG